MTPPKSQKLFTLGRRCGRLANRLIIFANLIALAEEQGHRVINFTFHSYSGLFGKTRENLFCEYPVPKRKHWLDKIPRVGATIRTTRIFYHLTRYACLLNERLPVFGKSVVTLRQLPDWRVTALDAPEVQEKIRVARIVLVYGWWFRSPNLVQKHGGKIRDYFRPLEKFEAASRVAVDRLRRDADIVIGVHVRHGDYRTARGAKYFFTAERYAAWMRELVPQFPGRRVSFLVCSDEPRNAGEFAGLTVEFGSSPVSDMYAMARCDYILGTRSTFTQWSSFYGKKPLLQVNTSDEAAKIENFRVCYLDWDL
jgi:hypothetical protein